MPATTKSFRWRPAAIVATKVFTATSVRRIGVASPATTFATTGRRHQHTYIGDLVVQIIPPNATGVGPVVLHNRSGGSIDNLNRSYDATSTPDLAQLVGTSPQGAWTMQVADKANQDVGKILRFTVELGL